MYSDNGIGMYPITADKVSTSNKSVAHNICRAQNYWHQPPEILCFTSAVVGSTAVQRMLSVRCFVTSPRHEAYQMLVLSQQRISWMMGALSDSA